MAYGFSLAFYLFIFPTSVIEKQLLVFFSTSSIKLHRSPSKLVAPAERHLLSHSIKNYNSYLVLQQWSASLVPGTADRKHKIGTDKHFFLEHFNHKTQSNVDGQV